jgi:hypothetical protein
MRRAFLEGVADRRGMRRVTKLAELINPEKDWAACKTEIELVEFDLDDD